MVSKTAKPASKWLLLSSMLVASLALSACQKSTAPADGDTADSHEAAATSQTDGDTLIDDMNVENTDTDDGHDDELTAEQKMIANLSRYRWMLSDIHNAGSVPSVSMLTDIKDQVTLLFNQNQGQDTLSYSVGCNAMSAVYQLQGNTLTTEESMSTQMLCQDLNEAENRLNTLMQGTSELSVTTDERPLLTQVTSDEVTLTWKGRLTSQAKYNSKGKTVFWAVNAKKVPCTAEGTQQCLQVKPITYDDQGIKTSEGKWAAFTGEIEGYQHDGKHDEVLRLQRYQLDAEVKGEEYAYVLDAVIESSVVE
ncbi:META domain-containing protein [Psychrobacter celer]|uniref:META domain-containing protein n=1 Tax=Psychrobacter celer TaxID=306572 RepID=UPI003FD4EFC4